MPELSQEEKPGQVQTWVTGPGEFVKAGLHSTRCVDVRISGQGEAETAAVARHGPSWNPPR